MRPLIVLLRVVALVCLAFLARAEGSPPQARTALVIGNAAYSFAPLRNPGSVTETLDFVGNAALGEIGLSEGSYKVEGKNADGTDYEGTVDIEKQGADYHLSWQAMRATASSSLICSPSIGETRRPSFMLSAKMAA